MALDGLDADQACHGTEPGPDRDRTNDRQQPARLDEGHAQAHQQEHRDAEEREAQERLREPPLSAQRPVTEPGHACASPRAYMDDAANSKRIAVSPWMMSEAYTTPSPATTSNTMGAPSRSKPMQQSSGGVRASAGRG